MFARGVCAPLCVAKSLQPAKRALKSRRVRPRNRWTPAEHAQARLRSQKCEVCTWSRASTNPRHRPARPHVNNQQLWKGSGRGRGGMSQENRCRVRRRRRIWAARLHTAVKGDEWIVTLAKHSLACQKHYCVSGFFSERQSTMQLHLGAQNTCQSVLVTNYQFYLLHFGVDNANQILHSQVYLTLSEIGVTFSHVHMFYILANRSTNLEK